MKPRFALLSLLLLTMLACSMGDLTRFLRPETEAATSTPVPPVETSTPTVTATQPPTQSPTPNPNCAAPGEPDPLVEMGFPDYPAAIQNFLNQGGGVAELQTALEGLGIATPPIPVGEGDLTGDGYHDVVVSILDLGAQAVQPPGTLLIFVCQAGSYNLAYSLPSGEFYGAPAILRVQDLNADGSAEVITSSSTCGAHTCFESAQILVWNGAAFEPRLQGSTEELPSPNLQITDYDLNGVYDLEVTAQGYGSVGAGPQRTVTQIWAYDAASGFWAPGELMQGPSNFRIHVLHDADEAMRRGEYDIAILLYDRVINDEGLQDWADPANERLNLGAYARYKTVVAYALQGEEAQAQGFLEAIAPLFPEGTPQHAYVEMAEAFLDSYLAGGQEGGCSAAQAYAAANVEAVLAPLGSGAFGYANPDYEAGDVCP